MEDAALYPFSLISSSHQDALPDSALSTIP